MSSGLEICINAKEFLHDPLTFNSRFNPIPRLEDSPELEVPHSHGNLKVMAFLFHLVYNRIC